MLVLVDFDGELAVGAEAGGAGTPRAAVSLVEPDDGADDPCEADEPAGDRSGEDGCEGAVAEERLSERGWVRESVRA